MAIELYPHNEQAYQNILAAFDEGNMTAVVHPTGTGKMYLALKWLYDHKDQKCLFLCPTKAIQYQFIKTMQNCGISKEVFSNLQAGTYAQLLNWTKEDLKELYDCIVFDEFHRCGAPKWGAAVNELVESQEQAQILGLSATPNRYFDKRNMTEELFDGNLASEMTLAEALVNEILPPPIYINTIYSFTEEMKRLQDLIDKGKNEDQRREMQDLLDSAKRQLEHATGIETILAKHLNNPSGKYLVFCKNIAHLNKMKKQVEKWFSHLNPEIDLYDVHSEHSDLENYSALQEFNQNNNSHLKLLYSVNMLTEGLHVDNVDGVILIRPTESHIIYLQQLGRALSSNQKKQPVILDMVNNIDCYENFYQVYEEVKELAIEKYERKAEDILTIPLLKQFQIYDYVSDVIRDLKIIDQAYQWSFEEWYELAKSYLIEHSGSTIPKSAIYQGKNLGKWFARQKQNLNKPHLTEEEVQRKIQLEGLGLSFESKLMSFEEWYELAKSYLIDHPGDTIPVSTTYQGKKLGIWFANQRNRLNKSNLTEEAEYQKIQLESLGLSFESNLMSFEEWYELAKSYLIEHSGSTIPNSVIYQGKNLGNWFARKKQDLNKPNLMEEEVQRKIQLEGLGLTFEKLQMSFEEGYELTKDYLTNYPGDTIPKSTNYQGKNLGNWFVRQKQDLNKPNLTEEEVQRKIQLEGLGLSFESKLMSFEEWYELAKSYLIDYPGDEIPKSTIYQGKNLGKWLVNQRHRLNKPNLTEEAEYQKTQLESLGLSFEGNLMSFEEWYELAKSYLIEYPGDEIPKSTIYQGKKLGGWFDRQKQRLNKPNLTEEKAQQKIQLEGLGLTFESKLMSFEEWYELVKSYLIDHPGDTVPSLTIYQGKKLGAWFTRQKQRLNKLNLTEEEAHQKIQLEGLGLDLAIVTDNMSFEKWRKLVLDYLREHPEKIENILELEQTEEFNLWLKNQRKKIYKQKLTIYEQAEVLAGNFVLERGLPQAQKLK